MDHHLRGLVATAANLGIMLMSQPFTYDFSWRVERQRRDSATSSLVVFPEFTKVSDKQGRPLEPPQILVSAIVLPLQKHAENRGG